MREFDASMEQADGHCRSAVFRTWHTDAKPDIKYNANGRNPGLGCIAAADAVGGLAVREAGWSAGLAPARQPSENDETGHGFKRISI